MYSRLSKPGSTTDSSQNFLIVVVLVFTFTIMCAQTLLLVRSRSRFAFASVFVPIVSLGEPVAGTNSDCPSDTNKSLS